VVLRTLAAALTLLVCALFSGTSELRAQDVQTFRVSTEPSGATFSVDGQEFSRPAVFLWPKGSKHIVTVAVGSLASPNGSDACGGIVAQYQSGCDIRYSFQGWTSDGGAIGGSQLLTQVVTADGTSTSLLATFAVTYRVRVGLAERAGGPSAECVTKANKPSQQLAIGDSTGIVFVGPNCFDYSGSAYLPAGKYLMNAIPLGGFVFDGWSINGYPALAINTLNLTGPVSVTARFVKAKTVRFYTNPPELRVRIDRNEVPTVDPIQEVDPFPVPGLFDFLPGSSHLIGAPSPQLLRNKLWVFSQWSNGQKQDSPFITGYDVNKTDVLTAMFVQGVSVIFQTEPKGLRLNIDGRENWPNYTFVWGLGSKYTVTAGAEQLDQVGRRWRFKSWKHGGPASQQIVMDQATVAAGSAYFTAVYESLPRVEIQSSVPGLRLEVNGEPCLTPCILDRAEGTSLRIAAAREIPLDETARLDFTGWSDGAADPERTVQLTGDLTLTARYQRMNRLAIAVNPQPAAANLFTDPGSRDSYYASGSAVSLTLEARPGFKFRRWEGDITGTQPRAVVGMSGPRSIQAILDRSPWLEPTAVRNAAGPTPVEGVAAGSLIRIEGASLAAKEEVGPRAPSPMVQTLGGVVVMVGDRLLLLASVAPEAITALLPSDLQPGTASLQYRTSTGGGDLRATFEVVPYAPGLFGGSATREDGSPVTDENPAQAGDIVVIQGTGFGPVALPLLDGFPVPTVPENPTVDSVTVTLGSVAIPSLWAGATPGASGRVSVRFRIPDGTSGTQQLRVSVAGVDSNTIALPVSGGNQPL